MDLTIIVPIDFSIRGKEIFKKLIFLIKTIEYSDIKLSIGYNNRNNYYDKLFLASLNSINKKNIFINTISCNLLVNMAKLRNIAFKSVNTKYILILDVDIYPDLHIFKYYLDLAIKKDSFSMAPCLYLTETGTKKLINDFEYYKKEIVKEYLSYSRKYVLHLAIPSSVIVLKSNDFKTIGGFNENYSGHGYEDFAFMVELANHYQLINLESNMLIDKTYIAPLLSFGFRAELAKLCLENILDRKFVFHLYHPKNSKERYYVARKKNSQIFNRYLETLVEKDSLNSAIPPLIFEFYNLCEEKSIDPNKFLVLFDGRPKNMDRNKSLQKAIQRKIINYTRKLINKKQ